MRFRICQAKPAGVPRRLFDFIWVRTAVLLAGALLPSSCTQAMSDQPRYDPLQSSDFFPNGSSARPLPAGVIAHDSLPQDAGRDTGRVDGKPVNRIPIPVDSAFMLRGRQRYDIYCAPCHDYVGNGRGMAAIRGFQRMPPSFHSAELLSAPAGRFFDVITNGFGSMPSYAHQIPVTDRWAITAYVRALQLSQSAALDSIPPDERRRLEMEKDR